LVKSITMKAIMKICGATLGLVLLLSAITGCNKYEDGPEISIIPRADRVANTWIFAYAEEDGKNVSDQYDQYELYLNKDGDAELNAKYTVFGNSYETSTDGTWSFTNDQENIKLDFEDDDQDGEYVILRLTSDELWMRDVSQNLEIHLLEK